MLGRGKPLDEFLHVLAEVRRTLKRVVELCVVLYYNYQPTAVPSNSNEVSGS